MELQDLKTFIEKNCEIENISLKKYHLKEEFVKKSNLKRILNLFFYEYFCHAEEVIISSSKDKDILKRWFENIGLKRILLIIKETDYKQVEIIKLKKTLLRYNILLKKVHEEKNYESMIDLLIEIPNELMKKMRKLGYLREKNMQEFFLEELVNNNQEEEVIKFDAYNCVGIFNISKCWRGSYA